MRNIFFSLSLLSLSHHLSLSVDCVFYVCVCIAVERRKKTNNIKILRGAFVSTEKVTISGFSSSYTFPSNVYVAHRMLTTYEYACMSMYVCMAFVLAIDATANVLSSQIRKAMEWP